MKKILILLALLLLFGATPTAASDWSITGFRSEISINTDASIDVTEKISVNFRVAKHGIYRTIPFRYDTDQGGQISVPITVTGVSLDGQTVPYEELISGDNLKLKIGDPDRTITGVHSYLIEYAAAAAVNFFTDHDELYWNTTGADWEVPLTQVQAIVKFPAEIPDQNLHLACYSGSIGSRATDCIATANRDAIFTADDYLTIVAGWPKGIVTKPADYEDSRTVTANGMNLPWLPWPWLAVINAVALIIGLWWLIHRWRSRGRDPIGKQTVVAQYDPPPGLTPGEMGVLFDERADQRDLTATIVDMAVRGYLDITEIKKDKLLGLAKSTDYTLTLKKPNYQQDAGLQAHEKELLDGLFSGRTAVDISDLKGTFYQTVKNISGQMYQQVANKGFFVSDPQKARNNTILIGIALIAVGFGAFLIGLFVLPLLGIVTMIMSRSMPKRTAAGVEALWHARGFRLFLEKAEKYRLQWQEKEHIFETYLPYAMAFGVAEKWSQAFEGLQQTPPDWYHGQPGSVFNTVIFWSALNSFSTSTMQSFTPPAASGSSGFGGGGFSGGGFGGGGGGSW